MKKQIKTAICAIVLLSSTQLLAQSLGHIGPWYPEDFKLGMQYNAGADRSLPSLPYGSDMVWLKKSTGEFYDTYELVGANDSRLSDIYSVEFLSAIDDIRFNNLYTENTKQQRIAMAADILQENGFTASDALKLTDRLFDTRNQNRESADIIAKFEKSNAALMARRADFLNSVEALRTFSTKKERAAVIEGMLRPMGYTVAEAQSLTRLLLDPRNSSTTGENIILKFDQNRDALARIAIKGKAQRAVGKDTKKADKVDVKSAVKRARK